MAEESGHSELEAVGAVIHPVLEEQAGALIDLLVVLLEREDAETAAIHLEAEELVEELLAAAEAIEFAARI